MSEMNAAPIGNPKPKPILKLVEEEKASLGDSGLADSRNVTFSPATKIVEFSPLVTCNTDANEKSVCIPHLGEPESEEVTLDISLEEGAPSGPLQSSALGGGNMNIADVSTINHGSVSFFL